MFKDREDAGKRLGLALAAYRNKDAVVLAIPRGGVIVGYHVARYLDSDFSIVVARKLPLPYEPEAGFGAVAEDGSIYLADNAEYVGAETVNAVVDEERREIRRRIQALRGGKPLPDVSGRTVILVDDGIAMGSTMRASIALCRNRGAAKIAVAVPVAGNDTRDEIARLVDEIVVLETPRFFRAVAQVYENWYDVQDDEVVKIMEKWEEIK